MVCVYYIGHKYEHFCTQELLTFSENKGSLPAISGVHVAQPLVFCIVFCRFILAIVVSVLLRFTDSNYLFDIFKLSYVSLCLVTCVFLVFTRYIGYAFFSAISQKDNYYILALHTLLFVIKLPKDNIVD